jgi:uncharacterized membrane protein
VVAISLTESEKEKTKGKNISFRWTHIVLPGAILLISVILAASFYGLLPPEAAYHFENGLPDGWMSRGALIAWLIIPQLVLFLDALAVVSVATILSTRFLQGESLSPRNLLSIMGNMVALPQIILAFAMLDIFLYNAYRIHLIPVWVFALIIVVVGSVILGIFLIQALRHSRGLPGRSLQE